MTAVALVYFGFILLVFCGVCAYWDWRLEDRLRRSDRRVHLNLMRATGGKS